MSALPQAQRGGAAAAAAASHTHMDATPFAPVHSQLHHSMEVRACLRLRGRLLGSAPCVSSLCCFRSCSALVLLQVSANQSTSRPTTPKEKAAPQHPNPLQFNQYASTAMAPLEVQPSQEPAAAATSAQKPKQQKPDFTPTAKDIAKRTKAQERGLSLDGYLSWVYPVPDPPPDEGVITSPEPSPDIPAPAPPLPPPVAAPAAPAPPLPPSVVAPAVAAPLLLPMPTGAALQSLIADDREMKQTNN